MFLILRILHDRRATLSTGHSGNYVQVLQAQITRNERSLQHALENRRGSEECQKSRQECGPNMRVQIKRRHDLPLYQHGSSQTLDKLLLSQIPMLPLVTCEIEAKVIELRNLPSCPETQPATSASWNPTY